MMVKLGRIEACCKDPVPLDSPPLLFSLFFLVLLWTQSCLSAKVITEQASLISQNRIDDYRNDVQIRNATVNDVDDITDVLVTAFLPAPHYRYVYQFWDQRSLFHWSCMREDVLRVVQQSSQREDLIFKVIEAPRRPHSDMWSRPRTTKRLKKPKNSMVVAIALWETAPPYKPNLNWWAGEQIQVNPQSTSAFDPGDKPTHLPCSDPYYNCSLHLDLNITRAKDFDRQFQLGKRRYIDDGDNGSNQIYLGLLATHPEFDGHGYGAAHCRWGMEVARQKGSNVTLIATPVGYPLYAELGFKSVTNLTIARLDGKADLWFEVMRWEA